MPLLQPNHGPQAYLRRAASVVCWLVGALHQRYEMVVAAWLADVTESMAPAALKGHPPAESNCHIPMPGLKKALTYAPVVRPKAKRLALLALTPTLSQRDNVIGDGTGPPASP